MIPPPYVPPTPQTPRRYLCHRAASPVEIDGRLNKPVWWPAPWTEEFVDIEGDAKPRPALKTRAKMLWDDGYLYIGAEMDEPHVWGTLTQRDSVVYHDNDFEVFLNPTGDNHRYYELEINALNTIFDLFLPKPYRDGGPADHGWDVAGLKTAVHVDGTLNDPSDQDRGWSVEVAMPWAAFDRHGGSRCPPKDGDQWRINFSRVQWDHRIADGRYEKFAGRPEHNWVWSPQGVIDMHRPEQWGVVQFTSGKPGQRTIGESPPDMSCTDESLAARAILHRLYYAQLRFRHMQGRWAARLDELLGWDPWILKPAPGLVGTIELQTTETGWQAVQRARTVNGDVRTWWIRQDSLVFDDRTPPYDH